MTDQSLDNVDQNYIDRLIQIESGGNPRARTGSNYGLGQFSPDQFREFGITNPYDPVQQIQAIQIEAGRNVPGLTEILGRPPTGAEQYVAHQQGLAGAKALYGSPDEPAWRVIRPFYKSDEIAKKAITGNIPSDSPLAGRSADDISSRDFTSMWHAKFDRSAAPAFSASTGATSTGPFALPGAPVDQGRERTLADLQVRPSAAGLGGGIGGGFTTPTPPPTPPSLPLTFAQPSMIPATRLLATYGGRRAPY